MAQYQNQQQNKASDDEYISILFFGSIFLIAFLWWLSYQGPLVNTIVGALSYVYLFPFYWLGSNVPILQSIPFIGLVFFQEPIQAVTFLMDGGYRVMSPENRGDILQITARAASIYFLPIFGYLALASQHLRPEQNYRRTEDVDTLIHRQSVHWRTTRYARSINPLKNPSLSIQKMSSVLGKQVDGARKDISKLLYPAPQTCMPPKWSRAMRPEEWMISTGLNFDFEKWKKIEARDLKTDIDYQYRERWDTLNIDDISETMLEQFMEPWRGIDALSPSLKLICAVAVLYYDFKREEGEKLLNAVGILAEKNINIPNGMDNAIKSDPEIMDKIQKIFSTQSARILLKMADEHKWKATAIIRIMEEGRKNRGILASPTYLWLKVQDRRMWYVLNSIGLDAVTVEASGVMAHYKAERQIGAPLHRPAVYQASRSVLEDYLDMKPERIEIRRKKAEMTIRPADKLRRFMAEKNIWEDK